MSRHPIPLNPELIWLRAIEATISIRTTLITRLHQIRERAITRTIVHGKEMLACDKWAEDECVLFFQALDNGMRDLVLVEGEETFFHKKPDYTLQDTPVVILDMVDGSDLLERDLGNWCSALVVFDPQSHPPKILCSVVHDDRERIYSATEVGAFVDEPKYGPQGNILRTPVHNEYGDVIEYEIQYAPRRPIQHIPAIVRDTGRNQKDKVDPTNIGVCFYGQKEGHLSTTPLGLTEWLQNAVPNARDRVRIYTLAGNPMMVRLANGEMIHAVFEHKGQHPHDVVPGAFIALKAGAKMFDIDTGKEMNEEMLAMSLLRPNADDSKLRYVLSSDYELGKSLAEALRKTRKPGTLLYQCDACAGLGNSPVSVDIYDLPEILCNSHRKAMHVVSPIKLQETS